MVVGKIIILGAPILFIARILSPFCEPGCAHRNATGINYHHLPLVFLTPGVGNQCPHPRLLHLVSYKAYNAIDMEVKIRCRNPICKPVRNARKIIDGDRDKLETHGFSVV